ncbi:hypothetical protein TNCV_1395231 [Trichonephila clavipes]|nr:hypothetical protein TNCV_1395231 [Trichonephila clavipes]
MRRMKEKEETSVDVDKGGIEKRAWKLPDFIKRLSLGEREDQKTTKVKMKKGVVRKLRKSEIEFQKWCFKRRAKPKVTIWGDKAEPPAYWDRGKRSSRETPFLHGGGSRIWKTTAGSDCSTVPSEEFVAVDDDNVCTALMMADKDILEFVQNSEDITDTDSDDENEFNNAVPVPTSSKMRNIKKICKKRIFLQNGLQQAEVVVDFSSAHSRPMEIPCVFLTA